MRCHPLGAKYNHNCNVACPSWCLNSKATRLFIEQLVHSNNHESIEALALYEGTKGQSRGMRFYDLMSSWFDSWWRHQMETFSALLAFCVGNSPVPGEFPAQRPVTRSFEVFFDLRPNKTLSKQSWGWWSETPSSSLWRHRNVERPSCHKISWSLENARLGVRLS